MANTFCIPVVLAEQLKAAAKRGEIDIEKMYDMTSVERRGLFEKYVGKDVAKQINAGFERAMVSKQQEALAKWATSTFKGSEPQIAKQKDIFKKINELNEQGLLTPEAEKSFYEDLVAEKLGINVTPEETKQIADLARKIEELAPAAESIGDPLGNPDGDIEYLKAKRELENYLDSLTPSGNLKIITSTIARGNMLLRMGSMLVNINSNNIEGIMGSIVRRFDERSAIGLNSDYVGKLIKYNLKAFLKTGYDLSRMTTLDSDKKILGEDTVNSQGKGVVPAIGRFYEDKVFGLTQGTPDVAAATLASGDRGNLKSTRIAYGEGLRGKEAKARALEILRDASRVEPKTKIGQQVKNEMIADAERSTNTDKRILAERALKLRNLFNVGDLRFGDLNIPFVKTTANAIQSSLEAGGLTVPIEVPVRLIKMIKLVQGGGYTWGEAREEAFNKFSSLMIRAGLGITAAFLLANAIKKEDYMGIYPTSEAERELMRLKNAIPNSIRIGGKWYSLDSFGAIAAPMVGFLNAKKYGKDVPSFLLAYVKGTGYQVSRVPGLDFARQGLDSLNKTLSSTKGEKLSDVQKDVANFFVDYASSRGVPGFISDFAQYTDTVVRDTSSKDNILAPLMSKFPGLRQKLPEKKNTFGETTPTEGWAVVLFGGRVKTDQSTPLTQELDALSKSGNLPSIADVSKTSPRAKALKEQIGDEKFEEAMALFGKNFKQKTEKLIEMPEYKKAPEEKKAQAINSVKNLIFDAVLVKYGYKKPAPTRTIRE